MTDLVVISSSKGRVIRPDSSIHEPGESFSAIAISSSHTSSSAVLIEPMINATNKPLAWNDGQGYLAGVAPNVALVSGVGTAGVIVDLYQNGYKVATTTSDGTGAWEFDGLNPLVAFDVVASYTGFESIIFNGVYPDVNKTLTITGSFSSSFSGRGYYGLVTISGGSGIYSSLSVSGLPSGLSAGLEGNNIVVRGVPTSSGTSTLSISVHSSDGQTATASDSLVIFAPPTVWSTTNKASWINLTNSGQTASYLSSSWGSVAQGGAQKTSGQWYFEHIWNCSSNNFLMSGLIGPSAPSYSTWLGNGGGDAIGWQDGYGLYSSGMFSQPINASSYNVLGSGWAVMFCVDLDFARCWMQSIQIIGGSGSSGGFIGGGDPTMGTSPVWTWTPGAAIIPACCIYNGTVTISQQGSVVNTPPLGYSYWQ